MAVTVLQVPYDINTGNELVFTLSSDKSDQPQFRYVIDTYMSSSAGFDFLNRSFTYPNLSGTANINMNQIANDYLEYENNWMVTGSIAASGSLKQFSMAFGEQYSISLDVPAVTYPAVPAYYPFVVAFPGKAYKSEGVDANTSPDFVSLLGENMIMSWAPQAKYGNPSRDFGPDTNILLTNNDYHTITTYSVLPLLIRWKNSDGTTLYSETLNPGPDNPDVFAQMHTWGIGPKNLTELSGSWQSYFDDTNVAYVSVLNTLGPGYAYDYNLKGRAYDTSCESEYTRFAFINRFGFYDYYSIYNPLRKSTRVGRSTYTRPFVRYEDTAWVFRTSDRGAIQYKTDYEEDFEITTDFLSTATADWLTELFDSPEVYIQNTNTDTVPGTSSTFLTTDFIPVNITNVSVDYNMNQHRQKLFQYAIQFKYANPKPSR